MAGSSWGLQAFGALFDRRVQASGDGAATRSDFGAGYREDDAASVQVVLEPFPSLSLHERPLAWRLTGDTSKIGSDYASLGNPILLPDRRTSALRSESAWARRPGDRASRRRSILQHRHRFEE